MNNQWYVIFTRPRCEKTVFDMLSRRKFEAFYPLNKIVRKWSDRMKTVYEPLITSYVFVKTTEDQLQKIKEIDGVMNLVYWLGKPAVIKDNEIETIKTFLDEYYDIKIVQSEVNLFDTVKINNGPLVKMIEEVIEVKNNTVKIYLPSLGFTMVAEVDKTNNEMISKDLQVENENKSLQYLRAI